LRRVLYAGSEQILRVAVSWQKMRDWRADKRKRKMTRLKLDILIISLMENESDSDLSGVTEDELGPPMPRSAARTTQQSLGCERELRPVEGAQPMR